MKVDHNKQKIQGKEAEAMRKWQLDRMPSNEQLSQLVQNLAKHILNTDKNSDAECT